MSSANPAKVERLGKWLSQQPHDIVCMNECNQWQGPAVNLKTLAPQWGFPYVGMQGLRRGCILTCQFIGFGWLQEALESCFTASCTIFGKYGVAVGYHRAHWGH